MTLLHVLDHTFYSPITLCAEEQIRGFRYSFFLYMYVGGYLTDKINAKGLSLKSLPESKHQYDKKHEDVPSQQPR